MWRELLVGCVFLGLGVWLVSQESKNKPSVAPGPRKQLMIRALPTAAIYTKADPSRQKTTFLSQRLFMSRGESLSVTISRPYYKAKTIVWKGRTNETIDVKLVPQLGKDVIALRLQSVPSQVTVRLGEQNYAQTPTIVLTKRGQPVNIRLLKAGHFPRILNWKGLFSQEMTLFMRSRTDDPNNLPSIWDWPQLDNFNGSLKQAVTQTLTQKIAADAYDLLGNRMLHYASFAGAKDAIKLLFSKKANPNAPNQLGETPFAVALRAAMINEKKLPFWKWKQVLDELLPTNRKAREARGLDPERKDIYGFTPLLSAIKAFSRTKIPFRYHQRSVLNWAKQRKLNFQTKGLDAKNPIHYVVEGYAPKRNTLQLVRFLLAQKVSVIESDQKGKTPLDLAAKQQLFKLGELLKKAQARQLRKQR